MSWRGEIEAVSENPLRFFSRMLSRIILGRNLPARSVRPSRECYAEKRENSKSLCIFIDTSTEAAGPRKLLNDNNGQNLGCGGAS